ncbi:unnamed protein product, partial [Prorocentrum cordatum]
MPLRWPGGKSVGRTPITAGRGPPPVPSGVDQSAGARSGRLLRCRARGPGLGLALLLAAARGPDGAPALATPKPPRAASAARVPAPAEPLALLQFAVRYRDDENSEYHWRVLVARIGATPDLRAQIVNLAELHVIPLTRGALTDQQLAEIRRGCGALAMMHGAAVAPGAAVGSVADWRFADPAFALFGDVVEPAIIANSDKF